MSNIVDCHPLHLAFKEAEQQYSEDLVKFRQRPSNGYWGKVRQVGVFPLGKGTSIKSKRLMRVGLDPLQWEGVKDALCETNLCATTESARAKHAGYDTTDITLQKAAFDTDWICLDSLMFREMAAEELAHFEQGLQERTADVWDDKLRVEYIHHCGNKQMVYLPADTIADGKCDCLEAQCDPDNLIRSNAWKFVVNPDSEDGVPGQVNPNYLLVNIDPSATNAFERIGTVSTDLFDQATLTLEGVDENRPAISEGIDLFDIMLPDYRMGTQLIQQEDIEMNNAMSYGGFEASMLKKALGTKVVLRQRHSVRYDVFALKYYPDTDYNTALVAEEGYAHDSDDPDTWARMKRVYRYYPVQNPNGGIKWVDNPYFQKAPFGIGCIFTPEVMQYMGFPSLNALGSAKKEAWGNNITYSGNATWINPDEPCNRLRNKGYWYVQFGLAVKEIRPEFGYAWLFRIDNRIRVNGVCCPLPSVPCFETPTDYCFGTTSGGESAKTGTRGANMVIRTASGIFH